MDQVVFRYRGRNYTAGEVAFINELIHRNPAATRYRLAQLLCEAWGWVQANGRPRDSVCRSFMVELHRAGLIRLPPPRRCAVTDVATRPKPPEVEVDRSPVEGCLHDIQPLTFRQVRRSREEPLFNGLVEAYHYLRYTRPVGEHLKYVVFAGSRPVACLAFSSAPRHLGPRDRFIGWSKEARRRNIHLLAYNTRFLILPWVRVPHLASHLLGRIARLLPGDWQRTYGHPVVYLETFVDPGRFRGTCYRAANWRVLGLTTGRGKDDHTMKPNRPLKEILGYPLRRDFRELLCRL